MLPHTLNDMDSYKDEGDSDDPAPAAKRQKVNPNAKKQPIVRAPRESTAVYVTSLPLDVTVGELEQVFSKCGLIGEEIDSKQKRIKLYLDEEGNPKGDALIVFFRPESVKIAIQMLDESDFRLGQKDPNGPMRVQVADNTYKKQKEAPKQGNPRDKQKIIKKTQKLNSKLADWDDDDPQTAAPAKSSKWDKVVILKHMFTLEELHEDPVAIMDIKEDIREECEKLGEVKNVILYDLEADGVVAVKFSTTEAAQACVKKNDGRAFAGQIVEAYIPEGGHKFKKTKTKKADESDSEEERRLDDFGKWLEGPEEK